MRKGVRSRLTRSAWMLAVVGLIGCGMFDSEGSKSLQIAQDSMALSQQEGTEVVTFSARLESVEDSCGLFGSEIQLGTELSGQVQYQKDSPTEITGLEFELNGLVFSTDSSADLLIGLEKEQAAGEGESTPLANVSWRREGDLDWQELPAKVDDWSQQEVRMRIAVDSESYLGLSDDDCSGTVFVLKSVSDQEDSTREETAEAEQETCDPACDEGQECVDGECTCKSENVCGDYCCAASTDCVTEKYEDGSIFQWCCYNACPIYDEMDYFCGTQYLCSQQKECTCPTSVFGNTVVCNKNDNRCCTPDTCESLGYQCGVSVSDNCGGSTGPCGECPGENSICVMNQCECRHETCGTDQNGFPICCGENEVCVDGQCCTKPDCGNRVCGEVTDSCGRTHSCGSCGTNEECTTEGQCVCPGTSCDNTCCENDDAVCYENQCCDPDPVDCRTIECGTINNGCGSDLFCGMCRRNQTCLSDNTCCTRNICGEGELHNKCGRLSDGCGGDMQCDCPDGQHCDLVTNTCCTPETCADREIECNGSFTDPCTGDTIVCETCTSGQRCVDQKCRTPKTCSDFPAGTCGSLDDGAGGTIECGCAAGQGCDDNAHQCKPLLTCSSYPAGTCGTLSDGYGGTINCGCASGQRCVEGICRVLKTCADYNDYPAEACGIHSDGWGGTIDCGECSLGEVCKEDGLCCAPICNGLECGSDGCGGSCGSCGSREYCSDGECVCRPNCSGKECGSNGCGGSCGFCGRGSICLDGKCEAFQCTQFGNFCFSDDLCCAGLRCIGGKCLRSGGPGGGDFGELF